MCWLQLLSWFDPFEADLNRLLRLPALCELNCVAQRTSWINLYSISCLCTSVFCRKYYNRQRLTENSVLLVNVVDMKTTLQY